MKLIFDAPLRVKTDGRDATALCLKLDRYVEGNKEALASIGSASSWCARASNSKPTGAACCSTMIEPGKGRWSALL